MIREAGSRPWKATERSSGYGSGAILRPQRILQTCQNQNTPYAKNASKMESNKWFFGHRKFFILLARVPFFALSYSGLKSLPRASVIAKCNPPSICVAAQCHESGSAHLLKSTAMRTNIHSHLGKKEQFTFLRVTFLCLSSFQFRCCWIGIRYTRSCMPGPSETYFISFVPKSDFGFLLISLSLLASRDCRKYFPICDASNRNNGENSIYSIWMNVVRWAAPEPGTETAAHLQCSTAKLRRDEKKPNKKKTMKRRKKIKRSVHKPSTKQ